MGRNKKKAVVKEEETCSSGTDHEKEPNTTAQLAPEAATADRVSNAGSEAGSDEKPKKRKEYKGNKLSKLKGNSSKADKANDNAGEASSVPEEEVADLVITRQGPTQVLYCPICTFPAEACEFSGMMEKCRPWLREHAAELADAEERGRKRRILTQKDRLEALMEGRGIKKALERIVVIEVEQRTGKRMITSVFGMDLYGLNLKDLSREWRKAFSCGAGVRAAETGKHQECIDIQGNVADQLGEMIVKKYNVPKESIYRIEKKKKVPFF